MQNCNGFAEAALRHYLIMPTHHPTVKSKPTSENIHNLREKASKTGVKRFTMMFQRHERLLHL